MIKRPIVITNDNGSGSVTVTWDNDREYTDSIHECQAHLAAVKNPTAFMAYLRENAAVDFEHWDLAEIRGLSAQLADFQAWLENMPPEDVPS